LRVKVAESEAAALAVLDRCDDVLADLNANVEKREKTMLKANKGGVDKKAMARLMKQFQ